MPLDEPQVTNGEPLVSKIVENDKVIERARQNLILRYDFNL